MRTTLSAASTAGVLYHTYQTASGGCPWPYWHLQEWLSCTPHMFCTRLSCSGICSLPSCTACLACVTRPPTLVGRDQITHLIPSLRQLDRCTKTYLTALKTHVSAACSQETSTSHAVYQKLINAATACRCAPSALPPSPRSFTSATRQHWVRS